MLKRHALQRLVTAVFRNRLRIGRIEWCVAMALIAQLVLFGKGEVYAKPAVPPVLWGFDSVNVSPASINRAIYARGRPDFIAGYIDAIAWSPMNSAQAAYIHRLGIPIMVIDSSITSNDTTYGTGAAIAYRAIIRARALGIPAGVAIFSDIENTSAVDTAFIEGWYDTITNAGYKAGYYGNPYAGSSSFTRQFCNAIAHRPTIASQSILWMNEPQRGWTTAANAPNFAPGRLYCNGYSVGNVLGWQYDSLGGGSVNIDSDEINASVPLWY